MLDRDSDSDYLSQTTDTKKGENNNEKRDEVSEWMFYSSFDIRRESRVGSNNELHLSDNDMRETSKSDNRNKWISGVSHEVKGTSLSAYRKWKRIIIEKSMDRQKQQHSLFCVSICVINLWYRLSLFSYFKPHRDVVRSCSSKNSVRRNCEILKQIAIFFLLWFCVRYKALFSQFSMCHSTVH